ncbi:Six-hairpin glycosidase-like protein [Cyathus striatus]|nr:Six-hairpin glycosidase-like protein [Cyathus striatus]
MSSPSHSKSEHQQPPWEQSKSGPTTTATSRVVALTQVHTTTTKRGLAPSGKWDSFNFAPKSKTVYPAAIHSSQGTVKNAQKLVRNQGSATLSGQGSWVALDFGVEVGGLISLNFDTVSSTSAISLSFTESPTFIRPTASDDSTVAAPLKKGFWTQPSNALRGGFRYLTIVSNSAAAVSISNVSCAISFMPHVDDLRAYSGYFYTQDTGFHDPDFLTKIWYAGAYTVQTNTVPLNTGRKVPFAPPGTWANNATLGVAGPIIVDGAKRDSRPPQFVSTNDLLPTRNALSTMFAAINPKTGALPESGPPLSQTGSDTYHAWTLIGTPVWSNYTKAVAFLEGKVDETGLINITGLRDWARLGGGGHNAEGNALLYRVLTTAADLASHVNSTSLASAWSANATALKAKFNDAFWVDSTTTLCPQDANSFAVLYNLTLSADQAKRVSDGLMKNWNELGPVAPELPDTSLQAHFEAGNDVRALDLSTLLEGFTGNGSLAYRYYQGYNDDPSYTSHAHGWSSGPTSALTSYILGLTVTSPQGGTWQVAPHGGFETALGWFGVKWTLEGNTLQLSIDTPKGTSGVSGKQKGVGEMEMETVAGGRYSFVIVG